MVRYFLIAFSTGLIEKVYWHQLISAGYGLVDNRNNSLKKYPQFYSFKIMLSLLKDKKYVSHKFSHNLYEIHFDKLSIYWVLHHETWLKFNQEVKFIDIDGNSEKGNRILITKSPIYIIINYIC